MEQQDIYFACQLISLRGELCSVMICGFHHPGSTKFKGTFSGSHGVDLVRHPLYDSGPLFYFYFVGLTIPSALVGAGGSLV